MQVQILKVVIVDDEYSIVEWLTRHIEWEGYDCEVVGCFDNGIAALEYMKTHPIDLLLTDISMPGMTGLELIRKVREQFSELLILVISAYDKFSYVKEAFQYGILDYCLKPIDVNELTEGIKIARDTYDRQHLYSRSRMKSYFETVCFNDF